MKLLSIVLAASVAVSAVSASAPTPCQTEVKGTPLVKNKATMMPGKPLAPHRPHHHSKHNQNKHQPNGLPSDHPPVAPDRPQPDADGIIHIYGPSNAPIGKGDSNPTPAPTNPTPAPTIPSLPPNAAKPDSENPYMSLDNSPARAEALDTNPTPATTIGNPYTNLRDSPARADGIYPKPTMGVPFHVFEDESVEIEDVDALSTPEPIGSAQANTPCSTVGNAFAVTKAEAEATKAPANSSAGAGTPLIIGGCIAAVVGIAAFAVVKKRKQAQDDDFEDDDGRDDMDDEVTIDYSVEMLTPV